MNTEPEVDKCTKCGMSLENEQDCCPCEVGVCFHCCGCPEDCSCGCKNRTKKSDENAGF